MPVAGAAITGGSAILKSLIGRNANPLARLQTQLAQESAGRSRQLFASAFPLMQQAGSYYSRILSGDRGAMTSALAPEISGITQLYRGAAGNLDRMAPGAGRDVARAELNRDRVGKLGDLVSGARRDAAGGAAGVAGMGLTGGNASASIFNSLLEGVRADRQYSDAQGEGLGKALGPLMLDLYKAWQGRNKSGGGIPRIGGPLPTGPFG